MMNSDSCKCGNRGFAYKVAKNANAFSTSKKNDFYFNYVRRKQNHEFIKLSIRQEYAWSLQDSSHPG